MYGIKFTVTKFIERVSLDSSYLMIVPITKGIELEFTSRMLSYLDKQDLEAVRHPDVRIELDLHCELLFIRDPYGDEGDDYGEGEGEEEKDSSEMPNLLNYCK